jgi:hypothetical protein
LLGFGMVAFAQPQLETMSDTVAHSLGRSFGAGLLAQIVVLPTLGLVVTGLVLSIVGELLVPFVLLAAALLVILGVLGGFLSVAHAMGESACAPHGRGRTGRLGQQLPLPSDRPVRASRRCGSPGS